MIWCIGECLYDIVFKNGNPEWAVPGGSMMNAAVSAARFGEEVSLITELGDDEVGEMIARFLQSEGVSTEYVHRYKGNTTLALAFLDEKGDAAYQFYHHSPIVAPAFDAPDFMPGDVLMFGSFYSINQRNRQNINNLAEKAGKSGAWIYYDPNFRKAHLSKIGEVMSFIIENIGIADIVRGSDEDFLLISGAGNPDEARNFVTVNGCSDFILTRNSAGVDFFSETFFKHYDAQKVDIISTIGAGDSFNAGFATALHHRHKNEINEAFIDEAIGRAVIFASEVCESRNNFIGRRS